LEGPQLLNSDELNLSGALVAEMFTDVGSQKIKDLHVCVGGETVTVRSLFARQRLRVWSLSSRLVADQILSGSVVRLVTPRSFVKHVGVHLVETRFVVPPLDAAGPTPPAVSADGDSDDNTPEKTLFYPPQVLFNAMKLSRLLRNQDNIIDAVKYALHVVLPADKAEDLCQQIDSGELPVPGGKSLAHAWHKLDCLSVLWERELNTNRSMHRYVSADSSLKGYNYFCVRENNVQLPCSLDSSPVPLDFCALPYSSSSWQVSTFGYGASNLAFKFRNMLHGVLLKCETDKDLDEFRNSVLSWTSDQGGERKLGDCAFAVAASVENLRRIACQVTADDLDLSNNQSAVCYMWPRAWYMPGHIHILFNALETTVKNSRMWRTAFSDGLTAVAKILNSSGLRRRFLVTCMSGASAVEQSPITRINKQLLDWRWESLGHLLDELVPIVPILVKFWNLARMRGGSEIDGLSAIDAASLGICDLFLHTRWLLPSLELLRLVSHTINRWSGWLEGCACHEHIWNATGSWVARQKRFKEATGLDSCPLKGCRGCEMASGGVNDWLERLRTCDSPLLTRLLFEVSVHDRSELICTLQCLKDSLTEELSAKFDMWHHLPYSLLGLASSDIQVAKSAAKACRNEWANCVDQHKAHRVAHLFFGNALVSNALDTFCDSDEPLHRYPSLHNMVHSYCLTPLVERAIEGEHAKIEHVTKLGPLSPASVCSRIRAKYTLALLSDDIFVSWAHGRWQTHVFRSVLKPLNLNTKGWSRTRFLESIYLFGQLEQFADTAELQQNLKVWEDAKTHAFVPTKLALPGVQLLCLEWLKKRMCTGRLLALPSSLCRLVDYVGYKGDDVADASDLSEVLSLAGCDDMIAEVPVLSGVVVFRIINANPNARVLQHPWHLGSRPNVLRVVTYSRLPDIEGRAIFAPTTKVSCLDLLYLSSSSFIDVWQSLLTFAQVKVGSLLVLKGSVRRALALTDVVDQAVALPDVGENGSHGVLPEG
jgi:hypothetical protein